MKKTYRIKTNNQEQLQRKQNESDATSKWIEFQKTRPRRRIQDKDVPVKSLLVSRFLIHSLESTIIWWMKQILTANRLLDQTNVEKTMNWMWSRMNLSLPVPCFCFSVLATWPWNTLWNTSEKRVGIIWISHQKLLTHESDHQTIIFDLLINYYISKIHSIDLLIIKILEIWKPTSRPCSNHLLVSQYYSNPLTSQASVYKNSFPLMMYSLACESKIRTRFHRRLVSCPLEIEQKKDQTRDVEQPFYEFLAGGQPISGHHQAIEEKKEMMSRRLSGNLLTRELKHWTSLVNVSTDVLKAINQFPATCCSLPGAIANVRWFAH